MLFPKASLTLCQPNLSALPKPELKRASPKRYSPSVSKSPEQPAVIGNKAFLALKLNTS